MSSKQSHDKEVRPMRKIAPSMVAREELDRLLAGGAGISLGMMRPVTGVGATVMRIGWCPAPRV